MLSLASGTCHAAVSGALSHQKAGATAARMATSSAPTSQGVAVPDRTEFLNLLIGSSQPSAGVAASNTPMQGSRGSAARRRSPWILTLWGGDDSTEAVGATYISSTQEGGCRAPEDRVRVVPHNRSQRAGHLVSSGLFLVLL